MFSHKCAVPHPTLTLSLSPPACPKIPASWTKKKVLSDSISEQWELRAGQPKQGLHAQHPSPWGPGSRVCSWPGPSLPAFCSCPLCPLLPLLLPSHIKSCKGCVYQGQAALRGRAWPCLEAACPCSWAFRSLFSGSGTLSAAQGREIWILSAVNGSEGSHPPALHVELLQALPRDTRTVLGTMGAQLQASTGTHEEWGTPGGDN